MRDNVLQDSLLPLLIWANFLSDTYTLDQAGSALLLMTSPVDPDPTLGLSQFGAVSVGLENVTPTVAWNYPQPNEDGELHVVSLSGATFSNTSTEDTPEIIGWYYVWQNAIGQQYWVAGFFEETLILGPGQALTVHPAIVFPTPRGHGDVVL